MSLTDMTYIGQYFDATAFYPCVYSYGGYVYYMTTDNYLHVCTYAGGLGEIDKILVAVVATQEGYAVGFIGGDGTYIYVAHRTAGTPYGRVKAYLFNGSVLSLVGTPYSTTYFVANAVVVSGAIYAVMKTLGDNTITCISKLTFNGSIFSAVNSGTQPTWGQFIFPDTNAIVCNGTYIYVWNGANTILVLNATTLADLPYHTITFIDGIALSGGFLVVLLDKDYGEIGRAHV
jgi:hypothetical protein